MDAIMQGPKGVFILFDYTVAVLAIVANCGILVAVSKCTFSLPGYRRFLISLTASDLYVCCVNVLTLVFQIFSTANNTTTLLIDHPYFNCGANVLRTLQLAGFFTNLLNLCGMSFDHFFGIVYPLKYRYIMSQNLARLGVVAIWIISFALAFMDIPVNILLYRDIADSKLTVLGDNAAFEALPLSANRGLGRQHRIPRDVLTGSGRMRGQSMALSTRKPSFLVDLTSKMQLMTTNSPPSRFEATMMKISKMSTTPKVQPLPLVINGDNNTEMDLSAVANTTKNPSELLNRIFLLLQEEEEAMRNNQTADVCTFYHETKMWFEISTICLAILCSLFLTVSYGYIIKKVSDSNDVTGRRTTRKLIFTTALLLAAFMICWMPFISFELVMLILFQRSNNYISDADKEDLLVKSLLVQQILNSLLRTYPLIDPIIYAFRITAVQQQFIKFFVKHFPKCCTSCCARYIKPPKTHSVLSARISRQVSIAARLSNPFDAATASNGFSEPSASLLLGPSASPRQPPKSPRLRSEGSRASFGLLPFRRKTVSTPIHGVRVAGTAIPILIGSPIEERNNNGREDAFNGQPENNILSVDLKTYNPGVDDHNSKEARTTGGSCGDNFNENDANFYRPKCLTVPATVPKRNRLSFSY